MLSILLITFAMPVLAEKPINGWFIALKRCEAYQSKNKLTNPGNVFIEERIAYDLKGINEEGGRWYHIRIPGAPVTLDRWVSLDCGVHAIAANSLSRSGGSGTIELSSETEATDLLLALSWQPAFCEKKTSTTECKQLNAGFLPIAETQLSLHGLWPQPNGNFYCGVPDAVKKLDKENRWDQLPAPELDTDTADRLAVAMPGTASFLERHEWVKHGTCFFGQGNGDDYFDDSLRVLAAINESHVGRFLAENVGTELKTSDIRKAFDLAFGTGAGERVQVKCIDDQGRVLVQELTISLKGKITETADVGALIRAGNKQSPGCVGGIIDPAGLQ
jgi:ribonuclease T2